MSTPIQIQLDQETLDEHTPANAHEFPIEKIEIPEPLETNDDTETVLVKIVNFYSDRTNGNVIRVAVPENDALALDTWWNQTVFNTSGDGRGGYSTVEATVMLSPVNYLPAGTEYGWEG